jgi:hypothetical protein
MENENEKMVREQGCQMVCFQTKNPNLGKFWRVIDWKMLIYFMAIWNILWRFGIIYDHLVHIFFIWYIFPVLVSCNKKNLATLFVRKLKTKRKRKKMHFEKNSPYPEVFTSVWF